MALTKKEFWNMVNSKEITLGFIDTCVYNNVKYKINCDDLNNTVELKEY